ncbi:MAG: ComEC/Rec2 family competence protein [Candidatus Caccovivens sp.]
MITKEKKLFHFRPLFYGFLALLLAISSTRYLFAGNVKYIVLISVVLLAFVVYCVWSKHFVQLITICCIFLFGIGWYFVGISSFEATEYNQICQVEGRIADDLTDYGWRYAVTLKDVKIDGKEQRNISLSITNYDELELSAGDVISFEGYVSNVKMFELENFKNYYYRKNTPYICDIKSNAVSIEGSKLTLDEKFRLKVKDVLYTSMGDDNGAVAYAVLFGDKSDVDVEIKNTYNSAGIIHLLTVSGLHISFLIILLGFVLKKCRVRGIWNFLVCAIVLFGYAYLCGFTPSVVRAGIMGLVLLATNLSGKCYDNLNSVGLAGSVILLFSPLSAMDIGFLMSFFCVMNIIVFAPTLSKMFNKFLPKIISESFAVSISANLGIVPFGAKIFAVENLLSFFVNLIVVPFFGLLYPLLFVSALTSCVLPFMSFLLKICGWGFDFIYKTADFFGNTHLVFTLEPFNIFLVAIFFVLLYLTSRFFMVSKRTKVICCSCTLSLFFAVAIILQIPLPQTASISYCYNYGQVVLLKDNTGQSVLVDMGDCSFSKNLMHCQNTQTEYLFLLNSKLNIEQVQSCDIKNVICCDNEIKFDEEIAVQPNQQGKVGNFSFTYKFFNDNLLGIEIEFDEIKVLVLSDNAESALNSGAEISVYDFVILGENTNLADYFIESNILLSVYDESCVSSSYQKYGNICYDINGKDFKWRCLD